MGRRRTWQMKTTKKTKCVRPIKKTPARQPRPSQSKKKCNITKTASKDLNVLDDAHFKLSSPAATQKHVIRRKLYKTVYCLFTKEKKKSMPFGCFRSGDLRYCKK